MLFFCDLYAELKASGPWCQRDFGDFKQKRCEAAQNTGKSTWKSIGDTGNL